MNAALEAITRDLSSGRFHRRYRIEGTTNWLTYEACNADSAGEFEVVEDNALADVPHDALCRRCFAEPAD
jgi:hypothetical protein